MEWRMRWSGRGSSCREVGGRIGWRKKQVIQRPTPSVEKEGVALDFYFDCLTGMLSCFCLT